MDEKKEEKKNRVLKGQIPTSVFFILFGLSLALMPVNTVNILCKVVFGLVLIGAGLYHVFIFVMEKENITPHDMSEMLNKKSGMLGISGVSSDDRDVTKAAREGNPRAILAHEMLEYEITKFIGAYAAALNGCDVIVFTAGLGENQAHHRQVIGDGLTYLGVKIDPQLNEEMIRGKEGLISTPDSKVKVYVIPTNEELVIARDTKEIVEAL